MAGWRSVMVMGLLLLPTLASVQAQAGETAVLEDPSGDTSYSSTFGPSLVEGPVDTALDLRGLYLTETEDAFTFRLQVQGLDPDDRPPLAGEGRITIDFVLGDIVVTYTPEGSTEEVREPRDQFRLQVDHREGAATAELLQYDRARRTYVPSQYGCTVDDCQLTITADEAKSSWVIEIARDRLQDASGATPNPNLRLHQFLATSKADINGMTLGLLDFHDRMPDDGDPAGSFTPELGALSQTGHVLLHSDHPFRWSNGEETTYLYDVMLTKMDEEPDQVYLSTTGVPDGWDVQLPGTSLHLTGQRTIDMPVIVKTPFAHQHGAFDSFLVEARSERDETAFGQVELGIRYSNVPQPTGHHSRLWIHAAQGTDGMTDPVVEQDGRQRSDEAFMSALDVKDQPGSMEALILPTRDTSRDPARGDFTWIVPLEPSLKTGIDLNLTQQGTMEFEFESAVDLEEAVILGGVYHRKPLKEPKSFHDHNWDTTLGVFYSSESVDIPAGEPTTVSVPFRPRAEGDYIPFRPEGAFVFVELILRIDYDAKQGLDRRTFGPWLLPGSTIDLPLDEYHDPVEVEYRPISSIALDLVGEQRRFVNSGESTLFRFQLNNTGVVDEDLRLRLSSLNSQWATILGDTTLSIPSGGNDVVEVLVTAPEDSWQGRVAGPLLEAVSQTDSWSRASQRFFAEVDDTRDHPDMSHLLGDSGEAQEERTTSGVGALAGFTAVGLFAAWVRTRRL